MTITCPHCKRADQIQKVSHIYRNGTSSSTQTGWVNGIGYAYGGDVVGVTGATTTHGRTQTALAAQLSPPPEPKRTHWFWYIMPLVTWQFGLLIAWFAPLGKFGRLALLAIIGMVVATTKVGINLNIDNSLLLNVNEILLYAVFPITYYVALFRYAHVQYSKQMPLWEQRMDKWNRSYYCSRDALVFDSGVLASRTVAKTTNEWGARKLPETWS